MKKLVLLLLIGVIGIRIQAQEATEEYRGCLYNILPMVETQEHRDTMSTWYLQGKKDVCKPLWGLCGFFGSWGTLFPASTMWAIPSKAQLDGLTEDGLYWASYDYRNGARDARSQSALIGNVTRVGITLFIMMVDVVTTPQDSMPEFINRIPIYLIVII